MCGRRSEGCQCPKSGLPVTDKNLKMTHNRAAGPARNFKHNHYMRILQHGSVRYNRLLLTCLWSQCRKHVESAVCTVVRPSPDCMHSLFLSQSTLLYFQIFSRNCYGDILERRGYWIVIEVVSRLHRVLDIRIPHSNGYSSSYINRTTSVCTLKYCFPNISSVSHTTVINFLAPIMCIIRHRTCTQLCHMV